MDMEKIETEVRAAISLLREQKRLRGGGFSGEYGLPTRPQRALDALERVERMLDDPGNATASDAFLATPQKTCVKCNTPVSERGIDTDGGFHPGMACRRVNAARQGRPYPAKGGA
jgi:hypothetical protein